MNPEEPNREIPFSAIITAPLSDPKSYRHKFGVLVAATDIGLHRKENQDSVIVSLNENIKDQPIARLAVIDGITGSKNGLYASQFSAQMINETYKRRGSSENAIKTISNFLRPDENRGRACYGLCDVMPDNTLFVYKGGDVSVQVIRDRKIVWETTNDRNAEGAPTKYLGDRQGYWVPLTYKLRPEDRIIIASDFLRDNFTNPQIEEALLGKNVRAFIKHLDAEGMPKRGDNRAIILYYVRSNKPEKIKEDSTEERMI